MYLSFHRSLGAPVQLPTPETIRGMGTNFQCNDFWDRVGGLYRHRNDPHHRNDVHDRDDPQSAPK